MVLYYYIRDNILKGVGIMDQKQIEKEAKTITNVILVAVCIGLFLLIANSCSNSKSSSMSKSQGQDLNTGLQKQVNGDKLTKSEQSTVDSYNKWEAEKQAQEASKKYK